MLKIDNLSVQTRKPIFENVSFEFERGKIYGIAAVNGSGKTTLFRAITGLIPVRNGTVTIDGKKIEDVRTKIFYYESFEWLDGNLNALDYLNFVKDTWHSSMSVQNVIHYWDMDSYASLPIRKYSLGMKQRLVIAMYFVSGVQYMIMDEITNGLDELNRQKLFVSLRAFRERNRMILLSSHYREDLEDLCDVMLTISDQQLKVL